MKKDLTNLYELSLVIFIVFVFSSIGWAASELSPKDSRNPDLVSALKEKIFAAFSFNGDFYNSDYTEMCAGDLLLFCNVSDEFGWRRHPISHRPDFHEGIDLAALAGTFVLAPADGRVTKEGWDRGYGRAVTIDHGYAWSTKYAHLKTIYVTPGQSVKRGEIIGEVGSTGSATGPHLHFEMRYFGESVNPRRYFSLLGNVNYPIMTFANR